jgi:hypothetical protein
MKQSSYVYKWTHIPTGKWYIGSRTGKNSHPDDGYICSSKIVKPLISESPTEWIREILLTGSPSEMLLAESELLLSLNAKNDPLSFNQHNGDGKFTTTGISPTIKHREKISNSKKGITRPEIGAKVSKALTGVKKSDSHRENIRLARLNWKHPLTTCNKISKTLSKPCTVDGITIYESRKQLIAELGWGKHGATHPNFRYI